MERQGEKAIIDHIQLLVTVPASFAGHRLDVSPVCGLHLFAWIHRIACRGIDKRIVSSALLVPCSTTWAHRHPPPMPPPP